MDSKKKINMSLKCNIVTGFVLYWAYELYKYRRRIVPPMDRFRFPDF